MAVNIRGLTRIKSQALVNFPPTPSLNLDFTTPYVNGLNPLPSTVTFSRADAGAYATHVGPDGLVRRAAHNIVLYSEQMNNGAWTQPATVSADAVTAPNGTVTADKLIAVTNASSYGLYYGNQVYQIISPTLTGIHTWSVYAKAGELDSMSLIANASPYTKQVIFNLTNGTYSFVTGSSSNTDVRMLSVGNGWYRCSITPLDMSSYSGSPTINIQIYNTTSFTVGTVGIYIWGAQLEQNITPSYYVPTTSAAVYSTPRYDYDPVTLDPKGLLIEEARTNLIIGSNNFNNAANGWAFAPYTSGITITSSATVGPDGISGSATLLTSTVNQSKITYSPGVNWSTNNELLAFSLWIKRKTGTGTIELATNLEEASTYVDVTSQISSTSWTRISIVKQTRVGGGGTAYPMIRINTSGDEIYVYGSQVEKAAFSTSYIPTTSSTLTRAADNVSMTGTNFSSWFNTGTGTFYTNAKTVANTASTTYFQRVLSVNDGSTTSRIVNNLSTTFTQYYGGATIRFEDSVYPTTASPKAAFCYANNDFAAAFSGNTTQTVTSWSVQQGLTQINIGNELSQSGTYLNGTIAKIQYWPSRFSNEKLQLITKG